jgi:hypothetical protein
MSKTKDQLRKEYFAIRDNFYQKDTGFTKLECHDILKRSIFPMLADEENNWDLEEWDEGHLTTCANLSLNWLSVSGLEKFVEHCKVFIAENF